MGKKVCCPVCSRKRNKLVNRNGELGLCCSICWKIYIHGHVQKLQPDSKDLELDISLSDAKVRNNLKTAKNKFQIPMAAGCSPDVPLDIDSDEGGEKNYSSMSRKHNYSLRRSAMQTLETTVFEYASRLDSEDVEVQGVDLQHLAPDEFLNDTIIDFYIRHIQQAYNFDWKRQSRFHYFNSFFFKKLTSLFEKTKDAEVDQEALTRLLRWRRDVDIFDKSYICIPVHDKFHWSLAIICFPLAAFDETCISGDACFLHLDSLTSGGHSSAKIFRILRSYLLSEWKLRNGSLPLQPCPGKKRSQFPSIAGRRVSVPQQDNEYDCGCFLLYYLQYFTETAPDTLRLRDIESRKLFGRNWFPSERPSQLRNEIRGLIQQRISQKLPNIVTPVRTGIASKRVIRRLKGGGGPHLEVEAHFNEHREERKVPSVLVEGDNHANVAGEAASVVFSEPSVIFPIPCSEMPEAVPSVSQEPVSNQEKIHLGLEPILGPSNDQEDEMLMWQDGDQLTQGTIQWNDYTADFQSKQGGSVDRDSRENKGSALGLVGSSSGFGLGLESGMDGIAENLNQQESDFMYNMGSHMDRDSITDVFEFLGDEDDAFAVIRDWANDDPVERVLEEEKREETGSQRVINQPPYVPTHECIKQGGQRRSKRRNRPKARALSPPQESGFKSRAVLRVKEETVKDLAPTRQSLRMQIKRKGGTFEKPEPELLQSFTSRRGRSPRIPGRRATRFSTWSARVLHPLPERFNEGSASAESSESLPALEPASPSTPSVAAAIVAEEGQVSAQEIVEAMTEVADCTSQQYPEIEEKTPETTWEQHQGQEAADTIHLNRFEEAPGATYQKPEDTPDTTHLKSTKKTPDTVHLNPFEEAPGTAHLELEKAPDTTLLKCTEKTPDTAHLSHEEIPGTAHQNPEKATGTTNLNSTEETPDTTHLDTENTQEAPASTPLIPEKSQETSNKVKEGSSTCQVISDVTAETPGREEEVEIAAAMEQVGSGDEDPWCLDLEESARTSGIEIWEGFGKRWRGGVPLGSLAAMAEQSQPSGPCFASGWGGRVPTSRINLARGENTPSLLVATPAMAAAAAAAARAAAASGLEEAEREEKRRDMEFDLMILIAAKDLVGISSENDMEMDEGNPRPSVLPAGSAPEGSGIATGRNGRSRRPPRRLVDYEDSDVVFKLPSPGSLDNSLSLDAQVAEGVKGRKIMRVYKRRSTSSNPPDVSRFSYPVTSPPLGGKRSESAKWATASASGTPSTADSAMAAWNWKVVSQQSPAEAPAGLRSSSRERRRPTRFSDDEMEEPFFRPAGMRERRNVRNVTWKTLQDVDAASEQLAADSSHGNGSSRAGRGIQMSNTERITLLALPAHPS